MCSKNQINKMTRLFKTLPQRKKKPFFIKGHVDPNFPLGTPYLEFPLTFSLAFSYSNLEELYIALFNLMWTQG